MSTTVEHRTSKRQKTCTSSLPSPSCRLCDLNDETPLDQLLAISQTNADRWREIENLQEKIENYRSKIDLCESKIQKLKRAALPTLLMTHPEEWISLDEVRYEKENMIALLQSTSGLPRDLYGDDDSDYFLRKIIEDRDVYLALLDRTDFRRCFYKFGLPYILRSDKEVKLKLVHRYPECLYLEDVPSELLDDSDFLHAFLRGSEHKCVDVIDDGLRKFSPRLWEDPNLMLDAIRTLCNTPIHQYDSPTSFKPTFITNSPLLGDKAFCLRIAALGELENSRKCPIMLRDLSSTLRRDKEIVMAFCGVNGQNLEYASPQLRGCSEVVAIACQENPSAVIYALPCQTLSDLLTSKEFVLRAFAKRSRIPEVFDLLPLPILQDQDIAVAASVSSPVLLERIKDAWLQDRDFWSRVLEGYKGAFSNIWRHLPSHLRQDQSIALYVTRHAGSHDSEIVSGLVELFPQLMSDREVIQNVVSAEISWPNRFGLIPSDVFSDKQFFIELLQLDGILYRYHVPMRLRQDRDVVEAALRQAPYLLEWLPKDIQIFYPDLVAAALRKIDIGELDADSIAEDLWFQRDVALAYIAMGFPYDDADSFGERFSSDKEIILAIAEHNPGLFVEYCTPTFLGDKEFMLEVVKKQARLIKCVNDDIRFDFDLLLAAFANERDVVYYLIYADGGEGAEREMPRVAAFGRQVRKRLRDYTAYMTVLQGISMDSPPSVGSRFSRLSCHLPLLNQGIETAGSYKRLIAEFCGIPLGVELLTLKRVLVDLARWGF